VVDLDTAFGEGLLDVAVGQTEAQVPAHRNDDHVGWEAEAGERRPCDGSGSGAASSHGDSLPTLGSITADACVFDSLPSSRLHMLDDDRRLREWLVRMLPGRRLVC
jgi:hypothetical protein